VPYARSGTTGVTNFRPQAPVNRQIAQVWVPAPPHSGEYFVRFELYTGVLLAFVDTAPFDVQLTVRVERAPFPAGCAIDGWGGA
jgi:hypothetical protein